MNVSNLKGIGAARAELLRKAGIETVADLLEYLPRNYDDRSEIRLVNDMTAYQVQTIRGELARAVQVVPLRRGKKPMTLAKAHIKDATGTLELVWFNQPYLEKNLKTGREYVFTGMVKPAPSGRLQMLSPEYEAVGEITLGAGRIVPLYTPPAGFSQKTFRALVHEGLQMAEAGSEWQSGLRDNILPVDICVAYSLCGRWEAIRNIHFPESDGKFLAARRRLVFEELFLVQTELLRIKARANTHAGVVFENADITPLLRGLSFEFTQAQTQCVGEIVADMQSGRAMNRLVQGDVGSGKTAVAQAAAYIAIQNNTQAAIMAPTEVLARQHYESFCRLFEPLDIKVVLLAGDMTTAQRRAALVQIADGTAQMIVGTHALVQKGVKYNCLGLVVTDEQHRFGVKQRLVLRQKGGGDGTTTAVPHTLVMTATPIPRTLALILYGDLDISIIGELPPGRVPIKTYAVDGAYRPRIHEFIRKETAAGRQVYVICPAIEEVDPSSEISDNSRAVGLYTVTQYTKALQHALSEVAVACLHGRMKSEQKQQIMTDFKENLVQVLVSTTVIEVGVHVANASLMIIENAERFGLSQLHQLRGRVGRGTHESYCILVSDMKNADTQARLQAMTATSDGFALAEKDLQLRGGGDFFGMRQHGLPSFKIANLYRDAEILKEAQAAAQERIKKENPADEGFSNVHNRFGEVL